MNFNSSDKINNTINNCHYCLTPCTIFSRHKIILLLLSARFQKCISLRIDIYNENSQETTRHLTHFEQEKTKKNLIKRKKRAFSLVYTVPDFNITNIVITLCLQKVVLVVGARCVISFIYGFYGPFKHIPLMSNRL